MTRLASFSDASRTPGDDWDQGDVVEAVYFAALDSMRPGVLVTPACDIDQDKVDLWTFVALHRDLDIARSLVAKDLDVWRAANGGAPLSKRQQLSLETKLRELVNHRFGRYHWLPLGFEDHPAYVADFSCVSSLPATEVRNTARRVAALTSSWREQLPARYSAYMGRVGTVDFRREDMDPQIERMVRSLAAPMRPSTPGSTLP